MGKAITLRIGVLIDRLTVGGVEKCALEEVAALRELGIDAALLVLKRDAEMPRAFAELLAEVPVVFLDDRLPRAMKVRWRVPGFYFFSFFHILYALVLPLHVKRGEWDVIVSHNSYTSFTAWSLARFRRIPYVMFVWDPVTAVLEKAYPRGIVHTVKPLLMSVARWADTTLARAAINVIAGSNSYVEYLRALVRPGSSIVVVPPGCHPAAAPRATVGDFVLSATSWKEGKQVEVLLHAIAELPRGRAVLAGRWLHDGYRNQMAALSHELGLDERVEFLGELTEEEMLTVASRALCSVTPNAEMGFGMPSLEAAAQACTFVCPRVAGVAAYFKDGVEAFYFDEGDAGGLASVLGRLILNPDLARDAGIAAWRRARSNLTWRHHADTIVRTILSARPNLAGRVELMSE